MKNRFFSLTFILFLLLSINSLYAADFVAGFVGRFGASSATTDRSKIFTSDFRAFESSFSFQPGIFWGYDDTLSTALLFDIGYNKDVYEIKYNNADEKRVVENYKFNSLSLGIFPRLNIGFFSIGVGGGIKLPLSMTYSSKGRGDSSKYRFDFGDIKDSFETFYIPYVKVSADFFVKTKRKFMLSFGIYANYDFPIDVSKNGILKDFTINQDSLASFDIGFQFGMYFIS